MVSLWRHRPRLGFVPKLIMLLGAIVLVPVLCVPFYPQDARYAWCFALPCLLSIGIGILVHLYMQKNSEKPKGRQNSVVVVVGIWLYAFVLGGLPFFLGGQLGLFRAVFESVSGWTATGFTTMDVGQTPHIFLFFRSFMQFTGGIGFVLLMLLFAGGRDAMRLFSAEGHSDILEPNLISTARLMMYIYGGFTAVGTLLYTLFGMSPFDAINHSMSAMATGGFSTRAESIAYYNSIPIEAITILLMLVGGTNFSILALLVKGNFRRFAKIGEIRFLGVLLLVAIPSLAILGMGVYGAFSESLRVSVFQTVSAITSTGYSIAEVSVWKPAMLLLAIFLMLIGGGIGSTAGGMKYSRVYILWKTFVASLRRKFQPEHLVYQAVVYKPTENLRLTPKYQLKIHHFAIVYLGCFFAGSFMLALAGVPLEQALFDFASALGTIGLSTGLTGATASNYILAVQMVGMVLARLEVYIVFIFIVSGLRKIKAFALAQTLRG